MPYGSIKVDNIVFTNGGSDQTVTVSGLVASTSGSLTVTGTVQGGTIIGTSTISGATITGNTGQFTTLTGGTAGFTTVTGTTVTGTTANFASGVFTTQISGATVTGNVGSFATITGGVVTLTSGVFAAGSASAPSISFSSDSNTGIYSPGADQVAISTNGFQRLFVGDNGRIGIGVATPSTPLHIVNSGAANVLLVQQGDDSATNTFRPQLNLNKAGTNLFILGCDGNAGATGITYYDARTATGQHIFLTNSIERMRLDSSGRLGLGSSAPGAKLHISDTFASAGTKDYLRLQSESGVDSAVMRIGGFAYTGNARSAIDFIQNGGTNFQSQIVFSTSAGADATERGRWDQQGRFLVGTSSTSASLSILAQGRSGSSTEQAVIRLCRGSSPGTEDVLGAVGFGDPGHASNYNAASLILSARDSGTWTAGTSQPSRLVFSTTADGASSPTERMRISSSGFVGIGTPSALNIETGLAVKADQGNGGAGVAHIRNSLASGADASPCLVLSKTATTTSSSARFIQFSASDNATPMGGIVGNGASNVQFATLSDIRDKENIQPLAGSLSKIKQVEVVAYDWKASGEHVNAGFIAQNIETIFPEYVVENMTGEGDDARKGITGGLSSGYVAVLTAALQEAIAKIETLEAKVAAIEGA